MTQESQYVYKQHGAAWIETYTGIRFHLDNPEFSHEDIAHTLANNCRYNGHCKHFYSVAEHSLLVSALVYHLGGNKQQCLEGLLHDGTEAYLSDVPSPFKQLLPDWSKLDKALDAKLRVWANLPADKTGLVKDADWIALFIEAYHLLPGKGEGWIDPNGFRDKALLAIETTGISPIGLDPVDAERRFLMCWADLADDGIGYEGHGIVRKPL